MAACDAPGAAGPDDAADGVDRPAEWAKITADAAYFTHEYCVIDDAQGDGGGAIPFRLWPAQVRVLYQIMTTLLVVILKARQLGISWLCCAYALWLCVTQPGKTVLLYSQGKDEANELLRRIKVLYERLPAWIKLHCPLVRENTSELVWANESRAKSLPATQRAGRSLTASLVILDECAFLTWGRALFNALKPTIDGGGQLIVLSTANGVGGLFHSLWKNAVAGANGFTAIFLPWWSRPGRTLAWYARKLAEAVDALLFRQEYPATPREAFVLSGRPRFAAPWIEAQEQNLRAPLDLADVPADLATIDGLDVWEPARPGREYLVAADVAEGLEHGDACSAVVLDRRTWEQVATLHGRWEPDEYAARLDKLARHYHDATLIVERNNHGHAVLSKLRTLDTPNVADGDDGRPGWITNPKTKPQAVDALAVALKDGLITIRDAADLDEMAIYQVLAKGATSAPEGRHDDRVMKWAVALGWIELVGSAGVVCAEIPD